jgi:hypothetical protein
MHLTLHPQPRGYTRLSVSSSDHVGGRIVDHISDRYSDGSSAYNCDRISDRVVVSAAELHQVSHQ